MTDNPEELEKDWPHRRPKDLAPQGLTRMYLIFATLAAAGANLEAILYWHIWHSRHPADQWWFLSVFTMVVALQIPWLATLQCYRRIKKQAQITGANFKMQQLVRYQGAFLLSSVYLALLLILNSVEPMLH